MELIMRREQAKAFGEFVRELGPWSWFLTVTFRNPLPPPDGAIKRIEEWLADIDAQAGKPIGWILPEEYGRLGGRWHSHGLVKGTSHLRRDFWWTEGFRRFGQTRIEPVTSHAAVARYVAKYCTKENGKLHFGGTINSSKLSEVRRRGGRREWTDLLSPESSPGVATKPMVATSDSCEKAMFHMTRGWRQR